MRMSFSRISGAHARSKPFARQKLSRKVRIGVGNQRVIVRAMRLPAIEDPKDADALVAESLEGALTLGFTLLLLLCRRPWLWSSGKALPLHQPLEGATLGIVGLGHIGQRDKLHIVQRG